MMAAAQEQSSWQQAWHEVMSNEEVTEEAWEEAFELLEQLAAQPFDINQASRQDLEQLPFLSEQQVTDLLAYTERYGPMRTLSELSMVSSLGYGQRLLLPYFIYAGARTPTSRRLPAVDTLMRQGRHELWGSVRVPFYTREGDRNGYAGYRYAHELRYDFSYGGGRVRAGWTGSQDAGEPFFAGVNSWGYDAYSYYVQVRQWGAMENIVAGKYKLSLGKGLVMGSSFMPGKLASLQSLGRTPATLRPHASRSEADYLQGAAVTLRLGRSLNLTLFASHRPHDATLNDDGSARTLITSGYHRTANEMEKKHNTHATDAGLHTTWRRGAFHAGLTAAYTHFDRPLRPDTATLYRRYQPTGSNFVNVAVDYGCNVQRLSLSGETAIDRNGHVATLNMLSYQPSGQWALMAVQRFYSYRYQALHAHALSEGGHAQNESGLLVGTTWTPLRHWHVQAYADYAYFPWARSMASQSSEAFDVLVASTLTLSPFTLKARYRRHYHERNHPDGNHLLTGQTDHRARLSIAFTPPNSAWLLTTQADYTQTSDRGWMLSQTARWQPRHWLLSLTAAWFDTESSASRLYLYERQLPHQYAFASYYGRGMRLSLLAQLTIGRWQGHALLGHTRYFDRSVIGSGLQAVGHSFMTDLSLQLRYRLGR